MRELICFVLFFWSVPNIDGYYDSSLGRWLNVDPDAEQYQSWNAYQYTFNGPLNYIDPDGRGPWLWVTRWALRVVGVGNSGSKLARTYAAMNTAGRITRVNSFQRALQVTAASNRAKALLTVGNVGLGASLANEIFTTPDIDFGTYEIFPVLPDGTLVMPRGVDTLPPEDAVLILNPPVVELFVEGFDTRVPEFPSIVLSNMIITSIADAKYREIVAVFKKMKTNLILSRDVGKLTYDPDEFGNILVPQGQVVDYDILVDSLLDMAEEIGQVYKLKDLIEDLQAKGRDDYAKIFKDYLKDRSVLKN